MEIQQNNQLGQKYQKTAFDQTKLLIKVQNRAFGSGVKAPNSKLMILAIRLSVVMKISFIVLYMVLVTL